LPYAASSQERDASAFDKIEAWIDLIRSVDRDIDNPGVVLVDEWNALCMASSAVSREVGTPLIVNPAFTNSPSASIT